MTWEGVPWMVSEADHEAETGRLVAYLASGKNEGIAASADLAVVASEIPDGNVHILSGAASLLNRFPGGGQQSYAVRNEGDEVVALAPQGSSGVRYDLVCVVVEDPQYPGQPAPASISDGPYVKSRVYTNVPVGTTTLAEVDPDQTGYALALVKFDASDGTVNQVDIKDLRKLLNPRTQTYKRMYNEKDQAATGAGAYALGTAEQVFPPGASFQVPVPEWATKMQLNARIANLRVYDTNPGVDTSFSFGYARFNFSDIYSAFTEWTQGFNASASQYPTTTMSYEIADEVDVPEEWRGKVKALDMSGQKDPSSIGHNIGSGWGTIVVVEVTFYEAPSF